MEPWDIVNFLLGAQFGFWSALLWVRHDRARIAGVRQEGQ